MRDSKLEKSIVVQASAESVFKAYSNPDDIRLWHNTIAQVALRAGGFFTYSDTTGDVYEGGEFLEVRPNELLRFRMEHHGFYRGSEVTMRFSSLGPESTEIRLEHAKLLPTELDHLRASWDWCLGNLKTYMETGSVQTFKGWFKNNKQNYEL